MSEEKKAEVHPLLRLKEWADYNGGGVISLTVSKKVYDSIREDYPCFGGEKIFGIVIKKQASCPACGKDS